MEVLYHIRLYFGAISPYIALKSAFFLWNRYLHPQSVPGMAIDSRTEAKRFMATG
jgi:hypothetical protein